jgi:hypothetical protein
VACSCGWDNLDRRSGDLHVCTAMLGTHPGRYIGYIQTIVSDSCYAVCLLRARVPVQAPSWLYLLFDNARYWDGDCLTTIASHTPLSRLVCVTSS